jgi:hypothetical protein
VSEIIPSYKTAQSIVGMSPGRPIDDFYPTPDYVTEALLDNEKFSGGVWEPACGDGAICKVFARAGYETFASDLNDHGYGVTPIDFLKTSGIPEHCQSIVTNPPFRLWLPFARHAVDDLDAPKVALFGKLSALEGQERSLWLESSPLHKVYVFRRRVQLTRNGEKPRSSGMIAFAWFVWTRGYTERPVIRWI